MDLEAQLLAAGYSAEDAKKLASGFKQGLTEMGLTDANATVVPTSTTTTVAKASPALESVLLKSGVSAANAKKYAGPLDAAMAEFNINNKNRKAMFLAQCMHESGRLSVVTENLNYSAGGLVKVFKKYFDRRTADQYARKPEKIANRVYASRMGNGNEASGDGWKFRGRGLIQLTGKDNYAACGKALGKDLLADPSYLETPEGAARSAAWFWNMRKLNSLADAGDIMAVTKAINGGYNGLKDRQYYWGLLSKLII